LYVFSGNTETTYNPIQIGTATVVRDKIMAVFEWSEPFYKNVCSRFLQLIIQFFDEFEINRDLINVSKYCDIDLISIFLNEVIKEGSIVVAMEHEDDRSDEESENTSILFGKTAKKKGAKTEKKLNAKAEKALAYLAKFSDFEKDHLKALQNQICELIESDFGYKFEQDENTLDLLKIIEEKAIVVFSVDGLKYSDYVRKLGRLLVQEIKVLSSYLNTEYRGKKVMAVFEEFAAYVTPDAVDIVNKAREAGLEALITLQGLCDVDVVSGELTKQIINNCNTYIIMRMNESKNAEDISQTVGTYSDLEFTVQVETSFVNRKDIAQMGSMREVDRYLIHPNDIKNLGLGEAYICCKNTKRIDKVYVDNCMDAS
jgi:DNA-directed RNA polymerase subunit F